mmetsp:Transcript_100886/g.268164  ORF Transcript_100886/g.268164 Transcript_100886/m.268164 type:complete len:226 (-) Transcript_100886:171-848(-)
MPRCSARGGQACVHARAKAAPHHASQIGVALARWLAAHSSSLHEEAPKSLDASLSASSLVAKPVVEMVSGVSGELASSLEALPTDSSVNSPARVAAARPSEGGAELSRLHTDDRRLLTDGRRPMLGSGAYPASASPSRASASDARLLLQQQRAWRSVANSTAAMLPADMRRAARGSTGGAGPLARGCFSGAVDAVEAPVGSRRSAGGPCFSGDQRANFRMRHQAS